MSADLRGSLHSPVPREYVRLFPEALRRLHAPPWPPFSRPTRICSAISARGGPGRSEPRRRRRGSRGGADGDRGGATAQAPLCVTASTASALATATSKSGSAGVAGGAGSACKCGMPRQSLGPWDLGDYSKQEALSSTWQRCSHPARWGRNWGPPGKDKELEPWPGMEGGPAGSGASKRNEGLRALCERS